jgi:hypothetical protein
MKHGASYKRLLHSKPGGCKILVQHQWQQSEMLYLGWPSFNCSTNNVAESTGYLLLVRPVEALAVRERGSADAIRGLCEILCQEKKIGAKYLDYKVY